MVTLRPITPEDTDFMIQLVHDPDTTKYIPGLITEGSAMRSWIEQLSSDDHELIVLADGRPVGECNLAVNGESAEIGFLLLSSCWRRGYGTAMMNALLRLAEQLGIHEITAMTDQENIAAIRLLEKSGFRSQSIGWFLRMDEDERIDPSEMGQSVVYYSRQM